MFLPQPAHLMPKVRYVQLTSAGVYKNKDVVFYTTNGVHPPQIAEWVFSTYLIMTHRLLDYAIITPQKKGKSRQGLFNSDVRADSPGMRIGILGYGAIGRQCARVAQALGMEVYACTRRERATPEQRRDGGSYCVPGTGDPEGTIPVKWFHGSSGDAVNDFLAQGLDILVLSLPLTEQTTSMIGREQFEILAKKQAFVSNVARGKLIDMDALVDALHRGKIRGAALDVTDPEPPLPDDHPLLAAPNVFITPHISWKTPSYWQRILAIVEANLERLNSEESLLNVVDKRYHY
ncbi:putative 2-hydroxyacid dehydrogenase [Diplogelasinospora grovesii]|uniref:2-hydroxyacid dehydrogenase n=1 Tax=Diplogelasinospora grovesii TaxID=303347 RepID=A0AAN6MUB6_9PEZI|nr:putative 2-hydroxyacid dehydrogenase [Diplogelasinospora grovesii]